MLAAGAKLKTDKDDKETVLHFGARAYKAELDEGEDTSGHNNMDLLKFLVAKFKDQGAIDTPDRSGFSALFQAAKEGVTDAVTLLMEHGADWRVMFPTPNGLALPDGVVLSVPFAARCFNTRETFVAMIRCVFQQNKQTATEAIKALEQLKELSGHSSQDFDVLIKRAALSGL